MHVKKKRQNNQSVSIHPFAHPSIHPSIHHPFQCKIRVFNGLRRLLSFGKNVLAGVPPARPTSQSRFLLSSAAPPKFRCDHTSSLYRSEARVRSTFALLVGRPPTLLGCVLLDTRYINACRVNYNTQWKYCLHAEWQCVWKPVSLGERKNTCNRFLEKCSKFSLRTFRC